MKIYLEEKYMPKSCLECNYENCEHQYIKCCYETRHPNCPLQPLADYTKQVRKEVLDIIDKKFNCCGYVEEKFEDIKEYILDQIQGE